MSNLVTPFRYDFVGSFLRPERLKKARADYEQGNISKEELTKVEDDCITELIKKTKELGYHVITDGEFRRTYWHLKELSIRRQFRVILHLMQKQL